MDKVLGFYNEIFMKAISTKICFIYIVDCFGDVDL
jgi:hypothetical protein